MHLPFSEAAIEKSVTALLADSAPLPAFEDGYREWRTAYEAGEAGVFTVSVAEAVSFIEAALDG